MNKNSHYHSVITGKSRTKSNFGQTNIENIEKMIEEDHKKGKALAFTMMEGSGSKSKVKVKTSQEGIKRCAKALLK